MKKDLYFKLISTCILCLYFIFPSSTFPKSGDDISLNQTFNLGGDVSSDLQYFILESTLITYAPDGKRSGKDVFKLYLKGEPAKVTGEAFDRYTCLKFSINRGDTVEVEIPSLSNWTYLFGADPDKKNQIFGIDHSKFENLIDSNGETIGPDISYHIYNAFIDYHSFCDVFSIPTPEGKGIQDLTKIGQKIVHDAAFSEPPTNLGANIAKGSFFRNGEITLEFKGLSYANKKSCALIAFDSGNSSFKMIMKPIPDMEIVTVGSSHYKGDIYKDLASNWVQKVTFDELVVSETTLPMPPQKINSVVERNILILNVSEKDMLSLLVE